MKRKTTLYIVLLAVLLIAAAIYYFLFHDKQEAVQLQVQQPSRGYIAQYVTATGKLEPVDTVSVGTQVSGIIKNLYVDFNSKVKKGELIAELDKSLLQATLDQDKGNLLNAQSQLIFQKSNFFRQQQLYKADAISKAEYDNALNLLNQAKANFTSTQAQVRLATKNLSYADIYSPIDGVVLFRNISPGQTVAATFNTPTLFIIARDIKKMEVEADVDEADIGGIKPGDRAVFTVDAFVNEQFKGEVRDIRLHPRVSTNVVSYTTIINAPNSQMKLKPGMTANVVVYTKELKNALLIPSRALLFSPDTLASKQYQINSQLIGALSAADTASGQVAAVWVMQGRSLFQKAIRTGVNDNIHVQVLSGLADTDKVVTNEITGKAATAATSGSPFLPKRASRRGRTR
jgi:HlyD family secretion protein